MTQSRVNGAALRAIRERSGLTIAGLAAAVRERGVQVGEPHISNIEAGRRDASPNLVAAMAKALAVPQTALLQTATTKPKTAAKRGAA